jgi:hypothetical protein
VTWGLRLVVLRGGPRGPPLGSGRLEPRHATRLETDDPGRAHSPVAGSRNPSEIQEMHPVLLSVEEGPRRHPSESAASEIRDGLSHRRVEADDVEHPGVGRLRDRTRPRPPRPATPSDSRPAGPRTRTDDLGNRRASRLHHGSLERTTRIERASRGWRPGALPAELRPRVRSAGSRPAELAVARHPREEGWPAGFEPAPAGVTAPGASVYTTATTMRHDNDGAGGIRTHGLELIRLAR